VAPVVTAAPDHAGRLRALHHARQPLLLPNIWDAASARIVESAGYPAVATSSAAVAEALGYADRESAPAGEMLDAVARIAAAVSVPVTADLERGYGMAPAELVERLAATGAAGCNLEDSRPETGVLVDPAEQAGFLAAVRDAATGAGLDLVINARIDTYLTGAGRPDRLAGTLRRARTYLESGADCVYPILLADPAEIRTIVEEAGGPVNILHHHGSRTGPAPDELARLGVARISLGPTLYRALNAVLARWVGDLTGV
jgi:2-methylisocitrate lyase-like PEP mutase family enzyme